jgi:hypothetical protein
MSLSDTFPLVDNALELSFTLGRDYPRRCSLTYFIPLSDVCQASRRPAFGACGFHVMRSHAGLGYAVIASICMVNLVHQPRPPAEVPSINIFSVAGLGVMRISHFPRHDRKMPSPLTLNDALVYALCGR